MVDDFFQSVELINKQEPQHLRNVGRLCFVCLVGMTVLIILDQLSKWWASQVGLVSINQGVSFGINVPPKLLALVLILILMGVGWGWWQEARQYLGAQNQVKKRLARMIFYSFILAGGISNLIDRLKWGGVRDWLPIPLTPLHNNLADWMIVIGCVGLAWLISQHADKINLHS